MCSCLPEELVQEYYFVLNFDLDGLHHDQQKAHLKTSEGFIRNLRPDIASPLTKVITINVVQCYYRPKRSFGQGNIFTPVCHSVHRGVSKFSGGPPNFGGGDSFKFLGVSIFWGGSSKFSGGVVQFSEYGQRSASTHPTGMHSCFSRATVEVEMFPF